MLTEGQFAWSGGKHPNFETDLQTCSRIHFILVKELPRRYATLKVVFLHKEYKPWFF
jgi:hypothetical protein